MVRAKTKVLLPVPSKVDKYLVSKYMSVIQLLREPEVVILNVIQLPFSSSLDQEQHAEAIETSRRELEKLKEFFRQQGINAKVKVGIGRDAADGIITEAKTGDYSLILMVKRRKGKFKIFEKSVTKKVLSHVDIPVISVLE